MTRPRVLILAVLLAACSTARPPSAPALRDQPIRPASLEAGDSVILLHQADSHGYGPSGFLELKVSGPPSWRVFVDYVRGGLYRRFGQEDHQRRILGQATGESTLSPA